MLNIGIFLSNSYKIRASKLLWRIKYSSLLTGLKLRYCIRVKSFSMCIIYRNILNTDIFILKLYYYKLTVRLYNKTTIESKSRLYSRKSS